MNAIPRPLRTFVASPKNCDDDGGGCCGDDEDDNDSTSLSCFEDENNWLLELRCDDNCDVDVEEVAVAVVGVYSSSLSSSSFPSLFS